jgi:hypothetical protein
MHARNCIVRITFPAMLILVAVVQAPAAAENRKGPGNDARETDKLTFGVVGQGRRTKLTPDE